MPPSRGTRQGWGLKFGTHGLPGQWNLPAFSLQLWHSWSLSLPFLSFSGDRGLHVLCGFEGCTDTQQGSQDAGTGAAIVPPSQSHKYKPASLSPPQPLLNVFTRAPLSVPFCYYKAFVFDAWAIQKSIHLTYHSALQPQRRTH